MPTPNNEVALEIAGMRHAHWQSYEIDSDLMIAADAFTLTMPATDNPLPSAIQEGVPVRLSVGGKRVLQGHVDEIDEPIGRRQSTITLTGRDQAAVLLDCSAPIFSARQIGLEEIIAKLVRPLGITRIRIEAEATQIREKVNVEPGDTAWSALQMAAEANGLWPWFEPDGTLVVGGPDYSTEPVAELVCRRDGKGNNMMDPRRVRTINERFSEVTVLGQRGGDESREGRNNVKATARDESMTWHRPKIVCDHEADTEAVALARARKILTDSRLASFSFTCLVQGHHTKNGVLWQPGQRVHVVSERHGLDAVLFLMGRKLIKSRERGTVTELRFKEDGAWVLDAHPHKRRRRRGKHSVPAQIVDVWSQP